jgi:hypothetical protein
MADVRMDEEVFSPRWLYHPSQPRGVLVETQDIYDKLMAQGGWVSSPAEFGLVTAPNRDQQVLQDALVMPAPPVILPTTGPAVSALEEKVADLETEIDTLHSLLKAMESRLAALEMPVVVEDKAPPAGQGKK